MTRSSASSKSCARDGVALAAPAEDRRLVADVGQVGAGQAARLLGDDVRGRRRRAAACWRVWTRRIRSRPLDVGRRDEDLAVEAPGAQQRGVELVEQVGGGHDDDAPLAAEEKPSISTSSWLSVCSRSELLSEPRRAPTASSSSMKMIAGCALRASRNRRRMRAAPRPANISTNDDADCEKKCAPDSWATALASSVLPVPGRPVQQDALGHLGAQALELLGRRAGSRRPRAARPSPRRRRRCPPSRPRGWPRA